MKDFRKDQLRQYLKADFNARSIETILGWFIANEGRSPVIVVGAGFTRNAIDIRTGEPVSQCVVPLWSHLIAQLESDLAISRGAYEPLTLAELYADELGPNALHNTLLGMVPDEHLQPGPAHAALSVYAAEAIVTTNQLDTVLDRVFPAKLRVIQDSDLALFSRPASRQIIYFHGHRSNLDSWVFTRSQYEDVFKTRPLITTRVRQLLSQHPVLVVGYSLTDPDFHAIYRQISLDMANRHPLGLVILLSEPHAAERRHWESLGMRLVALTSSNPSDGLTRFFRADPNGPLPAVDTLIADIKNRTGFAAQRRYVEDIWKENDQLVRHAKREGFLSEYQQFKLWAAVIDAAVPIPPVPAKPPEPFRFSILPQESMATLQPRVRLSPDWRFTRQLEVLKSCDLTLQRGIAEWLEIGWKRGLLEADPEDHEEDYINALSLLWREMATAAPEDRRIKESARCAVEECLSFAHRYLFDHEKEHITSDAEALGLPVVGIVADPESRPPRNKFDELARDGFHHAMNGEFADASISYGQAAEIARRSGEQLAEWFAVSGQLTYLRSRWTEEQSEEWQEELAALERKINQIKQEPSVARWIEKSEERMSRLQQETAEKFQRRRVESVLSTDSWTRSSSAHYAYRTVRDLEDLHAPPKAQLRHVEALLAADAFAGDIQSEFGYRLRFNIDKPSHWLRSRTVELMQSADEQRNRDVGLMAAFDDQPKNNTSHVSRLKAVPELVEIMQISDAPKIAMFLVACRAQLGRVARTFHNEHLLFAEYPRAWCAYAKFCMTGDAVGQIRLYIDSVNAAEKDQLARSLDEFPWRAWVAREAASPDVLMDLILPIIAGIDRNRPLDNGDAAITWAMVLLLRNIREFDRVAPSDDRLARLHAWATLIFERPNSEVYPWQAYEAGVELLRALSLDEGEHARAQRFTQVLALVERALENSDPAKFHLTTEMSAGLLAALLEKGELSGRNASLDALYQRLDQHWPHLLRHIELNRHHRAHFVKFLIEDVKLGLPGRAQLARTRLLELVRRIPSVLSTLASTLDRSFWGDDWDPFVEEVLQSAGGYRGRRSQERLSSALSLCSTWLLLDTATEVPVEMQFLVDAALIAVHHEHHAIANVASAALVCYAARTVPEPCVPRVMGALRSIAEDPRASVRGLAAFGAARLMLLAADDRIKKLAEELNVRLSQDSYAWVRYHHDVGTAVAMNELRRKRLPVPSGAS